jgi:putative ABC transport system permease protein
VQVAPAPGAREDAVKRALLGVDGVASVQRATAVPDAFDTAMSAFAGVLRVGWYAALVLALLMAFNVASVTADERAREHATMFAYGVRPRVVLALGVAEYAVVGVLATLVGLAVGRVIVAWMAGSLVTDTFPEIGLLIELAPVSLAAAAVAGVAAIALGPLFTLRRLQRMDVPSTLRVVE